MDKIRSKSARNVKGAKSCVKTVSRQRSQQAKKGAGQEVKRCQVDREEEEPESESLSELEPEENCSKVKSKVRQESKTSSAETRKLDICATRKSQPCSPQGSSQSPASNISLSGWSLGSNLYFSDSQSGGKFLSSQSSHDEDDTEPSLELSESHNWPQGPKTETKFTGTIVERNVRQEPGFSVRSINPVEMETDLQDVEPSSPSVASDDCIPLSLVPPSVGLLKNVVVSECRWNVKKKPNVKNCASVGNQAECKQKSEVEAEVLSQDTADNESFSSQDSERNDSLQSSAKNSASTQKMSESSINKGGKRTVRSEALRTSSRKSNRNNCEEEEVAEESQRIAEDKKKLGRGRKREIQVDEMEFESPSLDCKKILNSHKIIHQGREEVDKEATNEEISEHKWREPISLFEDVYDYVITSSPANKKSEIKRKGDELNWKFNPPKKSRTVLAKNGKPKNQIHVIGKDAKVSKTKRPQTETEFDLTDSGYMTTPLSRLDKRQRPAHWSMKTSTPLEQYRLCVGLDKPGGKSHRMDKTKRDSGNRSDFSFGPVSWLLPSPVQHVEPSKTCVNRQTRITDQGYCSGKLERREKENVIETRTMATKGGKKSDLKGRKQITKKMADENKQPKSHRNTDRKQDANSGKTEKGKNLSDDIDMKKEAPAKKKNRTPTIQTESPESQERNEAKSRQLELEDRLLKELDDIDENYSLTIEDSVMDT